MKWNFVIILAIRFSRLQFILDIVVIAVTRLKSIVPILITGIIFVASGSALATEYSDSKMLLNDIVAIEHLEIIPPLRGGQYTKGYFYLWNGTGKSIYLNKITDPSGQNFTLQKLVKNNGGQQWQNVSMPKYSKMLIRTSFL